MPRICKRFACEVPGMCLAHAWHMPGICLAYSLSMHERHPIGAQNGSYREQKTGKTEQKPKKKKFKKPYIKEVWGLNKMGF